ncbi:hypothetical protein OEG84_13260 [Hoeflea sp. G2-23]|uniref:Uncharacterized protein n=1 Tax=Hoeflea algicola TaxID=2983763 RepID=A0ABT3ZA52_9HYPH|nr:hypothetical protein [Hoeflea algicola]MCY0148546.1 hypothetical protein [Hoeflea algicola]MCY0148646.1 hypothetical protein [Hoeflea algicola]
MDEEFNAVAVLGRPYHHLLDQPADHGDERLLGLGICMLAHIVHHRINNPLDDFRRHIVSQVDRLGGPGHFQFLLQVRDFAFKLIDHIVEAGNDGTVGLDAIGDLLED